MKCSDIRNNFSDHIDNEALPEIAAAIEAHVAECAACRQELENYRHFVNNLRGLGEEELPFDFNAKLHQRLEEEAAARAKTKKPLVKRAWFRAVAGAACLVLLVGAVSIGGHLLGGRNFFSGMGASAPAPSASPDMAMYDMAVMEESGELYGSIESPAAPPPEPAEMEQNAYSDADKSSRAGGAEIERKIIRNCYLSLKVEDFDSAFSAIERLAAAYGGYVVSGQRNDYEGATSRHGYISIRVDANRLDEALAEIEALGVAENSNFSSNDVTADYYDIEGRLEQYQAQEARLMELYQRAETIEDLIALEAELTRVSAEIESLTGMIRYYDQLTALSLIEIDLYTPSTYTQTVEPQGWSGFWTEIREGFLNGVNGALDWLAAACVFIIRILPALLLVAAAALAVVLIVRGVRKKKRQPKQ